MRKSLDRSRLAALASREQAAYIQARPVSQATHTRAAQSLLGGVPMPWMARWPTPFPIYLQRAAGAEVLDLDGIRYADFCLGDSAAMAGHGPAAVQAAIAAQAGLGIATLLPSGSDELAATELARRFGLPYWQFALSATDANRFVLRLARELTGRSKVLVLSLIHI